MPLRVFYLDDEKDLCANFSDLFSSPDIHVVTFTDPLQAIQEARANPPDLFFVDYRLPSTNGDEVAQAIDPSIPKFLITGDADIETKYQFKNVFTKPYDDKEIQSVLDGFIRANR